MAEQQGNVTFTYTKTFDKVWDDGYGSKFNQTPEKNLSPSTYNVGANVVESDLSRPEFSKWQVNRETQRYWTFLPNQKLRGWDGKVVDGENKYFANGDWGYPTSGSTILNDEILPIYVSETLTDYDNLIPLPVEGSFRWGSNVPYDSSQTIVNDVDDRISGKLLRGETVTINGNTYLIQNIVFNANGDNGLPYDGLSMFEGRMTLMSSEPQYKPIQDPAWFGMHGEGTWYIGERDSYGDYSAKWPDRPEYNFETEADVWTFLENNDWNAAGQVLDFELEYQFSGFSPQPNLEDEYANNYYVGYVCGYDCHIVSFSVYGEDSGDYNGDGIHGFVVEVGDYNSFYGRYNTTQILIAQKAYYQYHIEEGAHWERVDEWKDQYPASEPGDSAENASNYLEYDGSPIYPYTITYTVVGTNYMYQLTNTVQDPAGVIIASGGEDPMPVADETSPSSKTIVVPFTYIVEDEDPTPSEPTTLDNVKVCGQSVDLSSGTTEVTIPEFSTFTIDAHGLQDANGNPILIKVSSDASDIKINESAQQSWSTKTITLTTVKK